MKSFSAYNPIVITIYMLLVTGIVMFSVNPILFLLSLFGGLLFFVVKNGGRDARSHLLSFGFLLIIALINPLVSHNGVTVWFVMNDAPITAEAVLYGLASGCMVIAVLYWFRLFTQIMTSDKLLYLLGRFSPRIALIISMGLRYVPLFKKQAKKINQTQTALGLYKDDNLIDRIRGGLRVFSVMMTWALENGIVTADSMTARGYGIGKRSQFSFFRFRKSDTGILLVILLLSGITMFSIAYGALDFVFYPALSCAELTPMAIIGYLSYGILAFVPTILEAEERLKWKYLKSKI